MEYKKTPGSATNKGQHYEYGMLSLLYLRSLHHVNSFLLGSNVAGLGQFDDIFFKFNWSDEKRVRSQICLIQLKHKDHGNHILQDQLLQTKGNFSLLKYYESYCLIEEMFKNSTECEFSNIIDDVNFEDCIFILFTNCTVDHNSQNIKPSEFSIIENILSTGSQTEAIFSFSPEDELIWRANENSKDSERYKAFLKHLRIFSGQCHVDQLDPLVMEQVVHCSQESGKRAEILYTSFTKIIENWWNNENCYLSESSPYWYKALVEDINASMLDCLKSIQYEFKPWGNEDLENEFGTSECLNIIIPGVDSYIRCLKILKFEKFSMNYLLLNFKDFIQRKNQVLSVIEKGFCSVLILDMQDNFGNEHLTVDVRSIKCKVVFVSGRKFDGVHNYIDTWNIDQLTDQSQESILDIRLEFQGQELHFKDLCESHLLHILDSKALNILLKGDKVTVGETLTIKHNIYILRTLSHQMSLQETILKTDHKDDLIAVSGFPVKTNITDAILHNISESTIIMSCANNNGVQLSSHTDHPDKTAYLDLCKKYGKNKNIHWLIYRDKFLTWKTSSGNKEIPALYVNKMSKECKVGPNCFHPTGLLTDWKERLLLVTGEPGMGKSTLLYHLSAELKLKDPTSWVVIVSLNKFTQMLQNMPADSITLLQIIEIIASAASVEHSSCPELARKLLVYSLEFRGNITVLLDAVDEVSPSYMQQVLKIVQVLLKTKVAYIWVTSRTVLQEYLQRELSTLPLVLEPFTKHEQQSFLTQYFAQQNENDNHENVKLYEQAKQVLELFKLRGSLECRHICDVPLHAQMIADTLKQLAQNNSNSRNYSELLSQLNLYHVYKSFFHRKRKLYYARYGIDESKSIVTGNPDRENELFMENHIKCALLLVFSPKEYDMLNIPDLEKTVAELLRKIEMEKTGIIDGLSNGKPKFVHFTFCEYLVAQWYKNFYEEHVSNSSNNPTGVSHAHVRKRITKLFNFSNSKSHKAVFKKLLEDKFDMVKLFFDQMLSDGCVLHEAVLTGNINNVKAVIDSAMSVDELDCGGRLPLHLAASHGYSEIVTLLLAVGSDVRTLDNVLGWSPLRYADSVQSWDIAVQLLQHRASVKDMPVLKAKIKNQRVWRTFVSALRAGHLEVTRLLPQQEFKTRIGKSESSSALYLAALAGHTKVVEILLENNAKINWTDSTGNNPLHVAALYGKLETVKVLLANGADVNSTNSDGDTALSLSTGRGYMKIVKLLIESKVDVNCRNIQNNTPLHIATHYGKLDVVQTLLEGGANVNDRDNKENTALQLATRKGFKEIVLLLLQYESDVNCTDYQKNNLLHITALYGHLEIMKLLLENGANIHHTNVNGDTVLKLAALKGNEQIVQLSIQHRCDINQLNRQQYSALHDASHLGNLKTVNVLLTNGADVHVTSVDGITALSLAAMKGYVEIVQLLIKYQSDVNTMDTYRNTPLHGAVYNGFTETVKMLLLAGADIQIKNSDGNNALSLAAMKGRSSIVRLLLENNAEVNSTNNHENTPLSLAAYNGHLEAVKILLLTGAAVEVHNRSEDTALILAAVKGHHEVIELLIENKANVNRINNSGNSALNIAAWHCHLKTVQVLLSSGADIQYINKDGNTPLHFAALGGNKDIIQLILDRGADVDVINEAGVTPEQTYNEKAHVDASDVFASTRIYTYNFFIPNS